jgi:glycosyltransferase involved in cell wall biosynthesis
MRIGIVFHKNPFAASTGIDLVRLRAIALGLIHRGVEAEIIAPVGTEGFLEESIPVRKLDVLDKPNDYDLVKTCYHDSMMLIRGFQGPVVSRIVRVVDDRLPERDEAVRQRLLLCQEMIKKRATALVLNNKENRERWINLYGYRPPITLAPTGCPSEIPEPRRNPFPPGERAILFLGSLASPRMVSMLNEAARMLSDLAQIHLVGLNKAHMYGGGKDCALDPLIKDHGELPEDAIWDYVRYASIGLAFATGPHAFDNDISKILNYLRGGLPVLSEEPILNNDLIRQTGFGKIFRFGDIDDMAAKAKELIKNPRQADREAAMRFMVQEHSWDKRVEVYLNLFHTILCG